MCETNMLGENSVSINGRKVLIEGERNLLELIRKAGIDLPTFCYHSELSVYGACRLCLVEVEGRGIHGACSMPPEKGMRIQTHTQELREIRKIAIELLLANHDQRCPTCSKSKNCQLQSLARKLGVEEIRFKSVLNKKETDRSSPSITRDPNRCVLCGDCVRVCSEIQAIGAIDFAKRGCDAAVLPSLGKALGDVECVNCGQCAAVCPTGALVAASEVEGVWAALSDRKKKVVVQIAPAVRAAIGECFGLPASDSNVTFVTGQMVAALKALGFASVFDTAFSADLTVIEEANEFVHRMKSGENLPQFTSCCPAWVKFAEQYFPKLLPNLSSCRSPQQMLGSLAKETLPTRYGIAREELVVVSVMPCTAKKFEARRPEFSRDSIRDVDYVLTTEELARMIEDGGLRFGALAPESFDLPMGFKTGAGVIFGSSGGVTEAVLRYAVGKGGLNSIAEGNSSAQKLYDEKNGGLGSNKKNGNNQIRQNGVREIVVDVAGKAWRLAIVHGLKNARELAKKVIAGEAKYDLVEVMACPGGCVGGAGQPVDSASRTDTRRLRQLRSSALYNADKALELHDSRENPFVEKCYSDLLGEVGGSKAHSLLHTHYQSRKRIEEKIAFGGSVAQKKSGALGNSNANGERHENSAYSESSCEKLLVRICVGTNCFVKGSQKVLQKLLKDVEQQKFGEMVDIQASFCFERCGQGPSAEVGGRLIECASYEKVSAEIESALSTQAKKGCACLKAVSNNSSTKTEASQLKPG